MQQFSEQATEHEREEDDADLLEHLAERAVNAHVKRSPINGDAQGDFEKRLGGGRRLFFDNQTGQATEDDGGDVQNRSQQVPT